jgi:hypothetical protein
MGTNHSPGNADIADIADIAGNAKRQKRSGFLPPPTGTAV